MRFSHFTILGCLLSSLFVASSAVAQQRDVSRYDLYTGFSDLNTPGLNQLNQVGFHLQAGVNLGRWTAVGGDYSVQHGSSTFTPSLAPVALQQQLGAALPPGYQLVLPFEATTQTFTGGAQLAIRKSRRVTFYVRPVLAAFRVSATLHPGDPIATLVAAQLTPRGSMNDWVGAYGGGGAAEFPVSHWLGARVQFDAGWNHPFSNLLDHGHVSYRYSVGPAFHFGHRVRLDGTHA